MYMQVRLGAWSKPIIKNQLFGKIITQTSNIGRGAWNLPHKCDLFLIKLKNNKMKKLELKKILLDNIFMFYWNDPIADVNIQYL